jgi:hypothetical protein
MRTSPPMLSCRLTQSLYLSCCVVCACAAADWGDYQPVAVLMHASAELLGQLPAVGPHHMKQQRLAYLMAAAAALGEWQRAWSSDVPLSSE